MDIDLENVKKLLKENLVRQEENNDSKFNLEIQLLKSVLKLESEKFSEISYKEKIKLFKIMNSFSKKLFKHRIFDDNVKKGLRGVEKILKKMLKLEKNIGEDLYTRVCVLFNNLLLSYFKHRGSLSSLSKDVYSLLEQNERRIKFPYGMNLIRNSMTQIYKRKKKFGIAMKICSQGIKSSSRWLKSSDGEKDKDDLKSVVKVLFSGLLLRAQIFRNLSEIEKSRKVLDQAKSVVLKYLPDDYGMLQMIKREMKLEVYNKSDSKSSKFSEYLNNMYQSSEMIEKNSDSDENYRKQKNKRKKIKINFSKGQKKRHQSAIVQRKKWKKSNIGLRKRRLNQEITNQRNTDSSPKFRKNNNNGGPKNFSCFSLEARKSQVRSNSKTKKRRNNRTPNPIKRRNLNEESNEKSYFSTMQRGPQNQPQYPIFGNNQMFNYQNHPMNFNVPYPVPFSPYNPFMVQPPQQFILQQKCNQLQELNKTLQIELLRAKSGVKDQEGSLDKGITAMKSSEISKSLNILDEEILDKIGKIQKEQKNMKEVKQEIWKKLEQINKKLDGDILPGFLSSENQSNCILKSRSNSRKKVEKKNFFFNSSNSPKSEKILKEEMSMKVSIDKGRKGKSSKKINSRGKIGSMEFPTRPLKRKATLTLGIDLKKRINQPINLQIPNYMIAYDYLTTTYYVYLENCLRKLTQKSKHLKNLENPKNIRVNGESEKKNSKKNIQNFWTMGKLKELDLPVKYQHKVITTSRGFWIEIYAYEYDMKNEELGRLLCKEKLNEDQIRYIFKKIKAGDVLPVVYPISTFKSIGNFINFSMSHFVEVKKSKQKRHEIPKDFFDLSENEKLEKSKNFINKNEFNLVIKSDIISLLPDIEMEFMGKKRKIIFIHLNSNNFRVIIKEINSKKNNTESQILDIHMSNSSIRKYFEVNHSNEANKILRTFSKDFKNAEEIVSRISSRRRTFSRKSYFFDENQEEKTRRDRSLMTLIGGKLANKAIEFGPQEAKSITRNRCSGQTGYGVKQKNKKELVKMVKKIILGFDEYLRFQKRTLKEVNSLEYYYLLRVICHKKSQFVIYEAYENNLSPTFILRGRNTFASYCKKKFNLFKKKLQILYRLWCMKWGFFLRKTLKSNPLLDLNTRIKIY